MRIDARYLQDCCILIPALERQARKYVLAAILVLLAATVLKAQPAFHAETVAGPGDFVEGGLAANAWLSTPGGTAAGAHGSLYIADTYGARISRIEPDGTIHTVAGTGVPGFGGDGGPAVEAQLDKPRSVAVDAAGNVYIADTGNQRIRVVTRDGAIATVAGTGEAGYSGDGGPAVEALLNFPCSLAVDSKGNLYISDQNNRAIRRIGPDGAIVTVAEAAGYLGDVAVGAAGVVYFADNYAVRALDPDGTVRIVAGTGTTGGGPYVGPALSTPLMGVDGIAVDGAGNLYLSESLGNVVRVVGPDGVMRRFAGYGGANGFYGDGGSAALARLSYPNHLSFDAAGTLYIGDSGNSRIRAVSPSGDIRTFAGTGYAGDGTPAVEARAKFPGQLAADPSGSVYFVDTGNEAVRRIAPDGAIGTVRPVVERFLGGLAADSTGNLYIGDILNGRVRRVAPDGTSRTLFAGGYNPDGLAIGPSGDIYTANSQYNKVQRTTQTGTPRLMAGTGEKGYAGDGGQAVLAKLAGPRAVALDRAGNLYIADAGNHAVRRVTPAGTITTVAGTGAAGYSGDDGPAAEARLNSPWGLVVDARDNLYIADAGNGRLRIVSPDGVVRSVRLDVVLLQPSGLAIDAAGTLYLADKSASRVYRLVPAL